MDVLGPLSIILGGQTISTLPSITTGSMKSEILTRSFNRSAGFPQLVDAMRKVINFVMSIPTIQHACQ